MCNRAFWIEVNLEGHVGKDVTCDFQYYGWWVLISEVEFESGNFFLPSKSVLYMTSPIQNREMAALLLYQTNFVGVQLLSYAHAFFGFEYL